MVSTSNIQTNREKKKALKSIKEKNIVNKICHAEGSNNIKGTQTNKRERREHKCVIILKRKVLLLVRQINSRTLFKTKLCTLN